MLRYIAAALFITALAQAKTCGCNSPAASPSVTISLPASPFMVAPSRDGCWVFVSLTGRGANSGIAVLKRSGGTVELAHVVPLSSAPTGIALTHDGKLLIAAATTAAIFVDVQKAISGAADPVVGAILGGRGSIYANTTKDDKLLFVSEESGQAITVIDLERARRDGYKKEDVIGRVPVGQAPIALTFSRNGKWLYTTSQGAALDWNWPKACKPEGMPVPNSVITRPEGAVVVVDVARAKADPAHAVVARVPAGCSPVRMSSSPNGRRIYVTARNSNAVLEFDTAKLISDGDHAMVGIAPVGDAPVPVMAVNKAKTILVGNSNRFAGRGEPQSLTVLDGAKIPQGLGAVTGMIPVGLFPREMAVSKNKRTLFLTNFGSNSLQVIDLAHLPVDSKLPPEIAQNAEALSHRHDYKPITVDPAVLSRYTGVYRGENGSLAIITEDGGSLTAKLEGVVLPMNTLPESETKFFVMTFGAEIEFPRVSGNDHAGQLILREGAREMVLNRLDDEAAKPILEAAGAFAQRLKDNKPLPGSEAAVRKLIADIQAGNPDESMFAANGLKSLPQLKSQLSQAGAVKSISFLRVGPAGPDIYVVASEKGSWAFRIRLAEDGKAEQATMTPGAQ